MRRKERDRREMGTAIAVFIAILAIFMLCSVVRADHWQWTERSAHHECAVKVRAGSAGGSGVWMEYGELRGVLTAAHVVEGATSAVSCTWPDGHKDTGKATTCKYKNDVAFIAVEHPSLPPLKFSLDPPRKGDVLELAGYGGPRGSMRHFVGKVLSVDGSSQTSGTTIDFCVMNGDSGSGILNESHEVVAVQSVGIGGALEHRTDENGNTWPIFSSAGSPSYSAIRGFLDRVAQGWGGCGPGGCPPQRPRGNGGGVDDLYPPSQPKYRRPEPPPPPEASDDTVIGKIVEKLDNLDKRLAEIKPVPGPPGPEGKQGPPGAAGKDAVVDYDDLAAQIVAQLPPLRVQIMGEGPGGAEYIHQEIVVPPGGTLKIPPIGLELRDVSGQVYDATRQPLGGTLKLQLRPRNQ